MMIVEGLLEWPLHFKREPILIGFAISTYEWRGDEIDFFCCYFHSKPDWIESFIVCTFFFPTTTKTLLPYKHFKVTLKLYEFAKIYFEGY